MGNKTPATLVNAVPTYYREIPHDPTNATIDQFVLRQGMPYLSPGFIIQALPTRGPFGVPYWMTGLALQTCVNMYGTAPAPFQKSIITHPTPALPISNLQNANGAAPTSGVYTGVEDSC